MRIPVVRGVIDRRILVNYRVEPEVLAKLLPQPFRPHLVNEHGIAGICLIRLKHVRSTLPEASLFSLTEEASCFFEQGCLGFSPSSHSGEFDALELRSFDWHVDPLAVQNVESSFFENRSLFPTGSIEFDSALLMRRIEHEWHGQPSLKV